MAGILDFLSSPESALGIGLLGAASSGKGFGGGLLDAVNYANAVQQHNEDRTLDKRYRDAQIQDLQRKSLADARQQALMADFFGGPSAPALGATPSATPSASPGSQQAAPQAQGGAGRLAKIAADYGLPIEALQADMLFNGGKKIAELVSSAAKPNWQNVNGNLVNTNAPGFQGGFQPGMSISANGQATAWQPDGQGGLVVGAPRGALETFRAYQGAAADNKPIKVYNPDTGREEYTSEGNVVRGARSGGNVSSPGYAGGSRDSAAQEQIRMVQNELMRLPQNHPDVPALQREIKRLQGSATPVPQSGNYAAGPSAAESAAAAAAQASAVDTAKANVVRDTGRQSENKLANKLTTGVDRALELLQQGPTASVVGNLADKGMGAFGMSTKGGETAAQLEALSGWLVSNVPRMEGPQSNMDVQNYQTMAGRIGDRNLPIGTRQAAAQEVKRLQQKYAELNGGAPAEQPSQSQSAPRATMRYNPQSGRLEKVN